MAENKKKLRREGLTTVFLVLVFIGVIILAGSLIMAFLGKGFSIGTQTGAATGKSALESFKDIAGESYIEELADISEAKKSSEPVKFLVDNSTYVLDDEAIEIYVESYITAAESTAQATGVSIEQLIIEEWGYESIDAYRKEAKELAHSFIKERLAVYETAKEKNIKISKKSYEEQLSVYAVKFGYATAVEFEYACTPASIANEMLYDLTLEELKQ